MQASRTSAPSATVPDSKLLAGRLNGLLRDLFLDPGSDHFGVIDEHGLSLTQVRALFLLACADQEPIPSGALADRLGLSHAAISRSLDSLVRRRLASRRESSADRRLRLLEITPAGRRIVDEIAELRLAGLELFVDSLDDHQRELLDAALRAIGDTEPA